MSKAFIQYLPQPAADPNTTALASVRLERFVPANLVTTLTLGNNAIADHTLVFKNGALLDPGAGTPDYTLAGKVITLHTAANGTDVFQVRYFFRVS